MANESNVKLFTQLYSKLAESLSIGTPNAMPGQNYLVLCNPGILLDPGLDLTNVDNQTTWASILNNIPDPNWVYTATNTSAADLYDDVLEGKELPTVELTATQKQELKSAEELLMHPDFTPTRQSLSYREYMTKYYAALTTFQTAHTTSANTGAPIPPEVQALLNQARGEWNTFGFKGQVETAQATVKNLSQLNPNAWWSNLQSRFDNATIEGPSGKFQPTTTYPGYKAFMGNTGWTSFSFSQQDLNKQTNASAVTAGGGVSASWGLWRASASGSYEKDTEESSSTAMGMTVGMEMMRSTILRPWMDPLVFRARTWRFGPGRFHGQHISTGTFTPGVLPEGVLMPLFPTGVLVARKVSITGAFSEEDQKRIAEAVSGSVSVGWGPFAISGRYGQSKSSTVSHASASTTSIANPDAQIIGFFCDVLPVSPNPDLTLKWPS